MPEHIAFKWEWNINTVAVLMGFVMGFVAWGYTLAEIKTGREQNAENISRLVMQNSAFDSRLEILERALARLDQSDFRMGLLEKSHENLDVRVSRIVETYSNQFADFRTQLGAISTQIALTNQTLSRIENTPRPNS